MGEDVDAVVLGPGSLNDLPAELPDAVWATRLHPFGLPLSPAPTYPVEDLTTALRQQPDVPPPDLGRPGEIAVVGPRAGTIDATLDELMARADELAAELGPTDRS